MTILAIYNDTERRLEMINDENIMDEYGTELAYEGYSTSEFSSMQKVFDANANKVPGIGKYTIKELIDFATKNNLL